MILRASRYAYLVSATIIAVLVGLLAKLLGLGLSLNADAGVVALIAGLLIAFVPLALRSVGPPELRASADGFALQVGLGTRRWTWDQIDSFRLIKQTTKSGRLVQCLAFDWCAAAGAKRETEWLNYPFDRNALDSVIQSLDTNLAASRAAGTPAPAFDPDSDRLAANRVARLKWKMGWVSALLGCIFFSWMIAGIICKTILLTPIDPRFELIG